MNSLRAGQITNKAMKTFGILPEHILKRLDVKDRPKGNAGLTAQECGERYKAKCEKEMHIIFEQWLNLNNVPCVHSRMDKRTTTACGTPDFVVMYKGKVICIEFKMPGNGLSKEQELYFALLEATGTPIFVYTMAAQAIEACKRIFRI